MNSVKLYSPSDELVVYVATMPELVSHKPRRGFRIDVVVQTHVVPENVEPSRRFFRLAVRVVQHDTTDITLPARELLGCSAAVQ